MSGIWDLSCQAHISIDLMQALGSANSSVLISPTAVLLTVGLIYMGSENNTMLEYIELVTCSYYKQDFVDLHKKSQELMLKLEKLKNSQYLGFGQLYIQNGIDIKQSYLNDMKESEVEVERVDFKDPEIVKRINNDVASSTGQEIKHVVDKLSSDTKLLAVSTFLIQTNWGTGFNEPKDGIFHVDKSSQRTIPMMQQTSGDFGYFENNYFRGIRLPLEDPVQKKKCEENINRTKKPKDCLKFSGYMNFLVFLPQERFGLTDVFQHLHGRTIEDLLIADETETEVDLTLPSFAFEYSTGLKNALHTVGLKDGFDPEKADFSNITSQHLYIEDILQTNKIEINSKGVTFGSAGASKLLTQKRFKRKQIKIQVDEPFLYAITEGDQFIHHIGVFR